ncbi:hypothetical protein [Calothrix sp. PCC 7507]|uniref:hypothetical protein n=1 Tax=Calothrix sp. PCC 7507 TaxID=99598 RepID=UPI00029F428C|nr:hypothetical protein [Calothrix sp. PCC 7507]AFY32003.1 hypothetical protein Cal7507_1543 [Calothrix sp. PCC 7507]
MVIKFAASSSSVKVLTVLAKAYEVKNPTTKVEFISDSQSHGAIALSTIHLLIHSKL